MKKTVIIFITLALIAGSCGQATKKQGNNEIAVAEQEQDFVLLQNETENKPLETNTEKILVKDMDNDGIMDSVYVENGRITCCLSTQNFEKMQSVEIDLTNLSGITDAKNGFYFENNWMRTGYKIQFRYDNKVKRMQLIGIEHYALGSSELSGEASVNLLTNDYVGNWGYFDKDDYIEIPTIKTKMSFGKIYLEDFSEEKTYSDFVKKSVELYHIHKKEMQEK